MKKQDLKDGMILEIRKGDRCLLTNGVMRDFEGSFVLTDYNEDLKDIDSKRFDIVKVYNSISHSLTDVFEDRYLTLIWERKEIKLTDREIELLKALKTLSYTYIARDDSNDLFVYETEPKKNTNIWWSNNTCYTLKKYKSLFKFIKWEDVEPIKIDDLLKGV